MMLRLPHSALRLATRSSVAARSCIAPAARTCATRSCIAPAARSFATRSCCGSGIRIASVAATPPLAASTPALPVALCARIASHETTLEPPAAVAPPDKPATGATTDAADAALYATLNARRAAVDEGAGRRYRVDNVSPGFLNVHTAPDDPFRTDNVVGRLLHNDVVESVSERGAWVEHDGGGWSIREYDGHRYLVPVND